MDNAILMAKKVTLVDALDRALNKGVVISGDITISLADVDLIYLGLKILLCSVQTAEQMQTGYMKADSSIINKGYTPLWDTASSLDANYGAKEVRTILPKIDTHPEKVEQGLARLVLTLVELIRRLMEKQALRRIQADSLTDSEVERLGETLMRLEGKMKELKKVFGLNDEDLNLSLGPLGELM